MTALSSIRRQLLGLAVLAASPLPLQAQPSGAEALGQKLNGVWLVQIGRSVGALHISRVEKTGDGLAVEATYSNARAKVSLDAAAEPLALELTTAAGTVMRLKETAPGALAGTFSARSGAGEVSATRFAPRRQAELSAKCGLAEGLWAGTWANGNLGAWTLWLGEVGADCTAVVRYGAVNETVTVQSTGFAFVCNPNTGGTCTFKPSGKELWVAYSDIQGGRNSAVFKPVE